ncbi:serine hydrolase domain-containing protein [Streptomyces sp. NPDC050617]|uniref:serine hydrolase domain-containing protein n=1 Tax=Streptomyces sp. NPDC050617 TaxID=3154628 RepID=UPI00342AC365
MTDSSPTSQRSRPGGVRATSWWTRRRKRGALAAVVAAGLAVGTTLTVASAQSRGPGDGVRQGLDRLVHEDGYPAALAATVGRDGRTHDYAAGVADLRTGAKAPVDGRVRAGSNTKPFTATVVLQLVGEGKIDLSAPVEKYLPKLVRGEGIDGRRITVRQLLQHTSGLPDYTQFMEAPNGKGRHLYVQPRSMLDLALAHKANFEPGKGWSYSNTNYLVAGLIIEKTTGRPLAEEIDHRVIRRAGLRHTYFPGAGDETIRGAHPEGYLAAKPGAKLENITETDPSAAWAAGQLITTPSDLNRFFSSLLGGKLLKPAQLAQMRTTVPAPGLWPGARYGLGLISTPLSCGGLMWGHGGDIPGYHTLAGATDAGRAAAVATTADGPPTERGPANVQSVVETALCR